MQTAAESFISVTVPQDFHTVARKDVDMHMHLMDSLRKEQVCKLVYILVSSRIPSQSVNITQSYIRRDKAVVMRWLEQGWGRTKLLD